MTEERTVEFEGSALQALRWGIVATVSMLMVIPSAWGAAAFNRWYVSNFRFSDGTQASFEGRGGQVWGYFAISALLGFAPQISRAVDDPTAKSLISIGLPILLIPISAAVTIKIIRWFFSSIRLSCGTNLSFKGSYLPFLGWTLLASLSIYTIVGWAWVYVAAFRWACRNIDGGNNELVFVGRGWEFLWRGFLALLGSLFIIPIPWIMVWLVRWFSSSLLIRPKAGVIA